MKVHGEPNRWFVGSRRIDAVSNVSRNMEGVAHFHLDNPILEAKPSRPAQDGHPFVLGLIVPEPRRRGLTKRYDALDVDRWCFEQRVELFGGKIGRHIGKKIHDSLVP
jgi:hypothetical protein